MKQPHSSDPAHPTLVDRLGPGAKKRLLEFVRDHEQPPPERRVFVNRTLRFETIGCIGFDLDWTLAPYRRLPLEKLVFDLTVERLIDHHGYPPAVRGVTFRPEFPRRGLLIDKEAGTVLGMSRHRYVNLAYAGDQKLSRDELKRLYRYEPIRPSDERFYHLDSLFELPEANLYVELTELSKQVDGIPTSSRQLFDDVRAAIDGVHRCGSLKSRVLAEPATYLDRSEELLLGLCRLGLRRRRFFLLTNSDWSYADGLCSHLFEGILPGLESWRELFDLVVVDAAKPGFFQGSSPFVALDQGGLEGEAVDVPEWGGVYSGGHLDGLMRTIDAPGDTVLYVGDHIYGDIVSSKRGSTWRTALIVHELEEEIQKREHLRALLDEQSAVSTRLSEVGKRLDHLRDLVGLEAANGEEGTPARREFEQATREHRQVLRRSVHLAEELGDHFNPYWGSFFKQGLSKTRFASQLETYACLYTSSVANFAFYGTDHYYRVTQDPMVHELR